jgi:hypothetical protein
MAQVTLVASTATLLAEPVGRSGAKDTMSSNELYHESDTAVYLGMTAEVDASTGFLFPKNTILHMTLKPYEALWAYCTGTPVVYVLSHVNEHARSS